MKRKLSAPERLWYVYESLEVFSKSGWVNLIKEESSMRHPDHGEVQRFLNGLYLGKIPLSRLNKHLKAHNCRVDKKLHYIRGYVKISTFKRIILEIVKS